MALFNRHQGENIRCVPFYQKKQSVFTDAPATLSHEISPLVLADQFFCGEVEGPLVLPVEREQNAKNNTYDVLSFVAAQCGATFAPVSYTHLLDEQIRQAVLSLETKWTEKEIGFQVELEEVKYTGNEGLFMHIWINLLDNAIKFSPSKGTITMFLKQEQDSVKFILEDEGPGIEDDVKSRIFDKFYQVDGSHKAEGNGLGLALVKRIVDSAGGTIKAENREYGGCRFVIELPKQKDEII